MRSPGVNNGVLESYSLEHTPTWAVAAVCIVFIAISLLMQRGLQRLGTWLLRSHKKSLYEALKKMKEELMLLGFISLLLTAAQSPMSRLCMPASWANQMLPCHFSHANTTLAAAEAPSVPTGSVHSLVHGHSSPIVGYEVGHQPHIRKIFSSSTYGESRRILSGMSAPHRCSEGHIPVLSTESLHQLHIFIFVMAVVHVFYSCFTMLFGFTQLRKWKKWEEETNEANFSYTEEIRRSFNEDALSSMPFKRVSFDIRQNTFVTSRAMATWSTNSSAAIWFNSFFRQFGKPVAKSDYLSLRLGFVKNHNAPTHLNFHRYIMNSLQDDLNTVIGISGYLWVFVIVFMILNVHGWYAYFWMSFIPVLINLVIGTKLQHIITQLALETAHAHVPGILNVPIKPRDELFWFNNPHLLLYLIHFILFQNAFELAFCIWLVVTFGFNSCFFDNHGFIISRVIVGILAQVLCSYSTLPLYALVSQMGSHYKKAIFADPVSNAVTDWRKKAKANIRHAQLRQHAIQTHRRSCELTRETGDEGGVEPHSQTHSETHPRSQQHHECSLTAEMASDIQGGPPLAGPNDIVVSMTQPSAITPEHGANPDLAGGSSEFRRHCAACEGLSLASRVDEIHRGEGNLSFSAADCENFAVAERLGFSRLDTSKPVYMKISTEDTIGGFSNWFLECSECNSSTSSATVINSPNDGGELRQSGDLDPSMTKTADPKATTPMAVGVQIDGKRRSVFLKRACAREEFTHGLPDTLSDLSCSSRRPLLSQIGRLPSRGETATFRPDLNTSELMLCTSFVTNPEDALELPKSKSLPLRSKAPRRMVAFTRESSAAKNYFTSPLDSFAQNSNESMNFGKLTTIARRLSARSLVTHFTGGRVAKEEVGVEGSKAEEFPTSSQTERERTVAKIADAFSRVDSRSGNSSGRAASSSPGPTSPPASDGPSSPRRQ